MEEATLSAVRLDAGDALLDGELVRPAGATGLVLFAHGSGSSRRSPRNRFIAAALQRAGIATFLFDLLTPEEEDSDAVDPRLRFDVELLARRLVAATDWARRRAETRRLRIGYFGASTGAAAALIGAVQRSEDVHAVVSRGGRVDLANDWLWRVRAPVLLVVGSRDHDVLRWNRSALEALTGPKKLSVVRDAGHLFEEEGALDEVARLSVGWFEQFLGQGTFDARP